MMNFKTAARATTLAATLAATVLAAGTALAQGTATYSIDPTHTFVTFEASHFGTSIIRARWDKKEGTVQFDRAAKTGRAEITIDMASINSGVAPFDGHLKSKDFFNVAENPTAKFVGERFVFEGDKVVRVEGALTMMGKTNPVVLTAKQFNCYNSPMLKREVCGGDFEATIARSQWGLTYAPMVTPDSIRLLIQVEAVKQ
jgi:polyisoprenoid-binding protein YceI